MILDILNEILMAKTQQKKLEILNKHKENEPLKRVFYYVFNPDYTFDGCEFPKPADKDRSPLETVLTAALGEKPIDSLLKKIIQKRENGVFHILREDLRCGVTKTTLDIVWPNLIPEYPFMMPTRNMGDIVFPAYAQIILNGLRVSVYRDNDDVTIRTPGGFRLLGLERLKAALLPCIDHREMLDGMLLCVDSGDTLLDQQNNARILNSVVMNTVTPEDEEHIHFFPWDVVDYSSTIPYHQRLIRFGGLLSERICPIFSFVVNDFSEIDSFLETVLQKGYRGIVVKNINGLWVPSSSSDVVEIKKIQTAYLKVRDVTMAKGNYISSLLCETRDGGLQVKIKDGLMDDNRKEPPDYFLNQIVEVKYEELTKNRMGLLFPRFVDVCYDKADADCLDDLK